VGGEPSPLITTLLADDDSGYVTWPDIGYDDPSLHMCLFLDGMLFAVFVITCVLLYHWSRPHTRSAPNLHGAKDAKFQMRQSKMAMQGQEEEDCTS